MSIINSIFAKELKTILDVKMEIISILKYFDDPRRDHKKEHSLEVIFYITIAAVLAGAESWYDVEAFGKAKQDFFSRKIKGFQGVPSHDTFNRVFSLIKPDLLERSFRVWIAEICGKYKGVVPIDGKTICGAKEKRPDGSFSKLHIVSAWASANGITLGQMKVEEKSNEITAIPALIEALDLSECIITIDAMGCQKKIVETIIKNNADYIICLKTNQGKLYEWVENQFTQMDDPKKRVPPTRRQTYTTENTGHGRTEKRVYDMYYNGLILCKEWAGLKSFIRVQSYRRENATGKETSETRYYISSLGLDIQKVANAIRTHWSIENNLHWQMDVTFNEDATRKKKNAAINFSLINKIALAIVKKDESKGSLKGKRKRAGWDDSYLEKLLDIQF